MTLIGRKTLLGAGLPVIALAVFAYMTTDRAPPKSASAKDGEILTEKERDIQRSGNSDDARQQLLERKVQRLEAKMADLLAAGRKDTHQRESESVQEEEDEELDPMMQDPGAKLERLTSTVQENTRRFEQQEFDADWAYTATSSIQDELTKLAPELGFRLQKAECRTSDCMATVEFESYTALKENASASVLAMRPYPVNCRMRVTTPPPENRDAPYQVKVFFQDCDRDGA